MTSPEILESLFREIGFESHLDGDRFFLSSCYLGKNTPKHLGNKGKAERGDWKKMGVNMRKKGNTNFSNTDFTLRFFDTRSPAP
jgi:hypothetical protein